MTTQKTIFIGLFSLIVLTLLVSPVFAHRRYRPYHKGLYRQASVYHTHEQVEMDKSATAKESECKKCDLLGGAVGIVTGTFKAVGNALDAVFGGKAEAASET